MSYKSNYTKRLRHKCSLAGKESQRVQAIKRQALSGEWDSFADMVERDKLDRKGRLYDVWTKTNLISIEIYHSRDGRSDQFDVAIHEPKKWSEGLKKRLVKNLSMPKLLRLWSEL
jgi:hypothetical protein